MNSFSFCPEVWADFLSLFAASLRSPQSSGLLPPWSPVLPDYDLCCYLWLHPILLMAFTTGVGIRFLTCLFSKEQCTRPRKAGNGYSEMKWARSRQRFSPGREENEARFSRVWRRARAAEVFLPDPSPCPPHPGEKPRHSFAFMV